MNEAPEDTLDPSVTERAEQIVDRLAQGVGRFSALAGLRTRKLVARTREEAEDMWAEAQNIRHRQNHKND